MKKQKKRRETTAREVVSERKKTSLSEKQSVEVRVVRAKEVIAKSKRKQFCECGKVETDAPLAMCEACQVCGKRMHTQADFKLHLKCLEIPASSNDEDAVETTSSDSKNGRPQKAVKKTTAVVTEEIVARWPFFFQCQRYPILRSQILTALMSGTPLVVDRLPTYILLDVILLATACREYHNAEIVDSYDELLKQTEEHWRKPDWTAKVFSSIHCNWADAIINRGIRDFESAETRYIPAFTGWFLEHDAPKYIDKELQEDALDDAEFKKRYSKILKNQKNVDIGKAPKEVQEVIAIHDKERRAKKGQRK
jgi:hypothetical protein